MAASPLPSTLPLRLPLTWPVFDPKLRAAILACASRAHLDAMLAHVPAKDAGRLFAGWEFLGRRDQLPPRDAELFSLRYVEGISNSELAEMLGMERVTVGTRLHRIRQTLQASLEQ